MDHKIHPLNHVQTLMDNLRPADSSAYELYAYHHELCLCYPAFVPKDAIQIARILGYDINNGLTKKLWNQIEGKIRILIDQGIL